MIENEKFIVDETVSYVQEKFNHDLKSHDWWHTYRVWKNAISIARFEKADLFIVELAALLHDIGDWKLNEEELVNQIEVWRE